MHREKARKKLHKSVTSYLEQILEAAHHKTTAVQSLTSHLKNHPKHVGHFWRSKDEFISDIFLLFSTHGHASVGQSAKTY